MSRNHPLGTRTPTFDVTIRRLPFSEELVDAARKGVAVLGPLQAAVDRLAVTLARDGRDIEAHVGLSVRGREIQGSRRAADPETALRGAMIEAACRLASLVGGHRLQPRPA